MPEKKVSFQSNGLELEGYLSLPQTSRLIPGAVLCHPHPLYGGNMDNNVILAVSRALVEKGIAALRFNFRGVGMSRGAFDGGIGEGDDAQAALSFLSKCSGVNPDRLGIMGYSFGGMVALSSGMRNNQVKAVAAVSPIIPEGLLAEVPKPVFIVYGTEDEVALPSTIIKETSLLEPGNLQAVDGVDHFWWGQEAKAAEVLSDFFVKSL
jgi:alpha/beta superfamily hydrolase